MRLFEFAFELLSPAIVTRRVTERGFHLPLNYIPSATLRGAILTALFHEGLISYDSLLREAESPRTIVSQAYPYLNGEKSYPCHPFAYKCKVPHENGIEILNYVRKVILELEYGNEPSFELKCSQGHSATESLHPKPVIPSKRVLKEVASTLHEAMSVGINKHSASSERGMLFDYEAIAAGQEFWATLALADEKLEIDEGFEFSIGRGISRGFGRARVFSIKELDLTEAIENVKNAVRNRVIVLYATSPLISASGVQSSTYPREIPLPSNRECSEKSRGKLILEKVYGKTINFHCGWDMKENKERPTLKACSSGSIAVARIFENTPPEAIAMLAFLGTIEQAAGFAISGVNMLIPLRGHVMEGD